MESYKRMNSMLTVQEVARLLHVHPNTLRRWTKDGRIKAYRIAPRGDRRFRPDEITSFLAELNAKTGDTKKDESPTEITSTVDTETTTRSQEPSLPGSRRSRRSKAHNDT